jgi:Na+-translocating ferredoxin:NAD+ oxidoreductase RnfA subunit
MNSIPVLFLLFYSAFTLNLLLQCGLGIKGAVESNPDKKELHGSLDIMALIRSGIIFLAVVLLWIFFSKIIFSLFHGVFIYVLIFPVSFLVYDAIEYLIFRYIIKKDIKSERFINFPGGITAVAVFLCMILANNFIETIVLSFGISSGIFFVKLIIREIRKRAALEAVPVFLRGKPLVLITMAMLSLVFTSVSLLMFGMLGLR